MRLHNRARVLRWAATTRRRHRLAGLAIRLASPALPEQPPPRAPIFIVGSPRSGTTMLFQLLDRSTRLASLGYGSHFIWEMYHPIARASYSSHAVSPEDIAPRERRVVNWMIHRITGGMRYLDKYPRMCLRVEYLAALFPDAWFVHITRDGRSVVSSLMTGWRTTGKFGFGTRLPVDLDIDGYDGEVWRFLVPPGWQEYARGHTLAEVCAFQWVAANEAILDAKARIRTDRWVNVSYEDLVATPVAATSRMLQALRLAGDPDVLERASTLDRNVTGTAVTPPKSGKWRDEHPREIESILSMIHPMSVRLGYAPSERH